MIQDESIPIEVRITAPITWDVQMKFIIQDLREDHFNEVVSLVKHHYFREDPMCRSIVLLQDKKSLNAYIELLRSWMKEGSSLVAVSRKSGRVVGALICKINISSEMTNTYSRVEIYSGESLPAIMALKSAIITKANVFEEFDCDKYLRIYALSVHPSYRKKPVAKALLEASFLNAFYLELPLVAGIFTSYTDQTVAKNVGLTSHIELAYNQWVVDEEVVFDDPGVGNYSAIFMYMPTPDEKTVLDTMKNKQIEWQKELLHFKNKHF